MTKFPDQPFDPGPQAPDFTGASDPFALFETWMAEAETSEPVDPNAMALATVDGAGLPNVRMVLLKAYGPDGFVFYTNSESAKGTELAAEPQGRAPALLEEPASPGPHTRAGRDGERRRGRRLFRHALAREPRRRLGVATVAAIAEPRRRWRRQSRAIRQSSPAGTWRGRLIGRATGWCRSRSSSGIAARTGCTTGSCSGDRTRARLSSRRGSIRSGGKGLFCRAWRRSPMKSGRR